MDPADFGVSAALVRDRGGDTTRVTRMARPKRLPVSRYRGFDDIPIADSNHNPLLSVGPWPTWALARSTAARLIESVRTPERSGRAPCADRARLDISDAVAHGLPATRSVALVASSIGCLGKPRADINGSSGTASSPAGVTRTRALRCPAARWCRPPGSDGGLQPPVVRSGCPDRPR
jgi:hypothetical protein